MANKDIKELDCSKMKIHPFNSRLVKWMDTNVPNVHNKEIAEKKGFTRAMVYRYVILMYDPKSPIQDMFGLDWLGRKYEACDYSGFPLNKARDGYSYFDQALEDMAMGKIDSINDIVISYLAWINSYKWKQLVYLHESHMRYVRGGLDGTSVDVKSTKEARTIWGDIEAIANDIGHVDDETEEFRSRFYYQIEQSRLALRPEDFAKALAGGADLIADSPYPNNYTIGKLRFKGDRIPDEK